MSEDSQTKQVEQPAKNEPVKGDEESNEAIRFAEWLRNESWEPAPKEFTKWYRKLIGDGLQKKTTAELYDLFPGKAAPKGDDVISIEEILKKNLFEKVIESGQNEKYAKDMWLIWWKLQSNAIKSAFKLSADEYASQFAAPQWVQADWKEKFSEWYFKAASRQHPVPLVMLIDHIERYIIAGSKKEEQL